MKTGFVTPAQQSSSLAIASATTKESLANDQNEYAALFSDKIQLVAGKLEELKALRHGQSDFCHLLEYCGSLRADIARQQKFKNRLYGEYGALRSEHSSGFVTHWKLIPRAHWRSFMATKDYLKEKEASPYGEVYDYTVRGKINGKDVLLTRVSFDHTHSFGMGLHHPMVAKTKAEVSDFLDFLLEKSLQDRGHASKEQIFEDLARLYYFGANLCPFKRGSGAAIEMLFRALLSYHGLESRPVSKIENEQIRVDIMAMSRSLDTFLLEFPSYFAS